VNTVEKEVAIGKRGFVKAAIPSGNRQRLSFTEPVTQSI
jgi:hypothetical protein